MKVLVIDDSRAIVNITEMILTDLGHNVMAAFDGIEGMRLFDNHDFDLVITDLDMPGINGNEVAFRIRASGRPYIPIIGISGNISHFEINRFDMIIQKPFTIKTLVDSIPRLPVSNFVYRMDEVSPGNTSWQSRV